MKYQIIVEIESDNPNFAMIIRDEIEEHLCNGEIEFNNVFVIPAD